MTLATGSRNRAGMTLIELTLVMALLVIVVGVGAPMLGRTTRAAVTESEARRVVALIERARTEAMARAAPARAWIDMEARRAGWEVLPGFANVAASAAPLRLRADVEARLLEAIDDRAGGAAATLAVFEPDGAVAGDEAAVLFIADARGEGHAVRLAADGWSFEIAAAGDGR